MLYIRMFLTMIVGLYTSRVVLATLGIEDYGIYSIVGGVVVMFTFLNASMSSATSRFMAFEIGKGDDSKIEKVFSNAKAVHLIIALIVGILLETLGLWILNEKLVIAEDRMFAAQVVYQLSVLSTLVSITQVPYNAAIISHENMDIYAYVELANVSLKLAIVYLLTIGNYDKLILYGILMLAVSVIIMMTYRIYCWRHYSECKIRPSMERKTFVPMICYASWGLYGDGCYSIRQQGTNILLNMFFGTVVNAANGIATTVLGIVSGFTQNILTAFRPQIVKSYAANDFKRMEQLLIYASKYALLLIGIMTIVLCFEMDYLLQLWLENVPQYTPWICRILLISFCIVTCSFVSNAGIQASGNIKYQSFILGTLSIFGVLPCTYLCLKLGYSPYSAYIIYGVFTILMYACSLYILKRQVKPVCITNIIRRGIIPVIIVLGITSSACYAIHLFVSSGFVKLIIIGISAIAVAFFSSYMCAMNEEEKLMVINLLKKIKR